MQAVMAQVRLHTCAVSSEPSLLANVICTKSHERAHIWIWASLRETLILLHANNTRNASVVAHSEMIAKLAIYKISWA